MNGPSAQGFLGLTGPLAPRVAVAADAAGCIEGLHRFAQGTGRKVLKMDRPAAGGFLGLTAFQAEGFGIALSGDEYEVSVTGFAFLCHRA